MTSLSPRPGNRLDWPAIWKAFAQRREQFSDNEWLAMHMSSRARVGIQELVENALADRESSLT